MFFLFTSVYGFSHYTHILINFIFPYKIIKFIDLILPFKLAEKWVSSWPLCWIANKRVRTLVTLLYPFSVYTFGKEMNPFISYTSKLRQ